MKRAIGLDLGSRRSKAVLVEDGALKESVWFESWSLDQTRITEWVNARSGPPVMAMGAISPTSPTSPTSTNGTACTTDATGSSGTYGPTSASGTISTISATGATSTSIAIGATGYSRRLAAQAFNAVVITEMKAFSLGIHHDFPKVRMIIDLGGQDAKVIKLGDQGQELDFEMNDRCAAGTGKFFEIAARTLGLPLEQLPDLALKSPEAVPVSSTCAVFAESEIIGQMASGADRPAIARGIYRSVAERLFNMIQRVGFQGPALMVGGGANTCLAHELSQMVHEPIEIPANGIYYGAFGVGLYAGREK